MIILEITFSRTLKLVYQTRLLVIRRLHGIPTSGKFVKNSNFQGHFHEVTYMGMKSPFSIVKPGEFQSSRAQKRRKQWQEQRKRDKSSAAILLRHGPSSSRRGMTLRNWYLFFLLNSSLFVCLFFLISFLVRDRSGFLHAVLVIRCRL